MFQLGLPEVMDVNRAYQTWQNAVMFTTSFSVFGLFFLFFISLG